MFVSSDVVVLQADDLFVLQDEVVVEKLGVFVEATDRVSVALVIVRSSVVLFLLVPVLSSSPPDMVREDDDLFVEEDFLVLEENFVVLEEPVIVVERLAVFLEEDFVALQAPVIYRVALDVFRFDGDVVVEEDDGAFEEVERCLELVAGHLESVAGRLEQVAKCLEENALFLEGVARLLLAERGSLAKAASLSTLPTRRNTQLGNSGGTFFGPQNDFLLHPHATLRSTEMADGCEATTRSGCMPGSIPSFAMRFR
jgi:hypothetical protein